MCRLISVSSESARDCIPDRSEESSLLGDRLGKPTPLAGSGRSASARVCSREGRWDALRAASWWWCGGATAAGALLTSLNSPTEASRLRSSWMRGLSSSAVTSRGSARKDARLPLNGISSISPRSTLYPVPEASGTRFAEKRSAPERGSAASRESSFAAASLGPAGTWVTKAAAVTCWIPSVSAMCFSMRRCWSPCSFAL
mmetsp:Transcript_70233/g.184107  ORF Transcript_70233/g.184107 Transcript_70233/m.184107 type:complete len:200 (-) Transcript_70233:1581-2180(-)